MTALKALWYFQALPEHLVNSAMMTNAALKSNFQKQTFVTIFIDQTTGVEHEVRFTHKK